MGSSNPFRRLLRLWWVVLPVIGLVIVLTVMVGVHFRAIARAQAEFDAEIATIRARGEPVWFADLAPEPIPVDQDGTPFLIDAAVDWQPIEFDSQSQSESAYLKLITQRPLPPPGVYPEFRAALDANARSLESLARAVGFERIRIPRDYAIKNPYEHDLPYVSDLRSLSRLLAAKLLDDLGHGAVAGAFETLEVHMKLAQRLEEDPIPIVHSVRFGIAHDFVDSLEMILGYTDYDESRFRTFDRSIAAMGDFRFKPSILVDRAMLLSTFENIGEPEFAGFLSEFRSHVDIRDPWFLATMGLYVGMTDPSTAPAEALNRTWGSILFRATLIKGRTMSLRAMGRIADLIDELGPEGTRKIAALDAELAIEIARFPIWQVLRSDTAPWHAMLLTFRQRLVDARLAMRVDRFHDERGRLPESLEEVLDDDLREVPLGLLSGLPVRYEILPDGFRIDEEPDESSDAAEETNRHPWYRSARVEVRYPPRDLPSPPKTKKP